MKETGRIRLLVFSVVLTVAVFALLWMTRPAADNEMIEIAKSRQLQPLMEIDAPARLSKTVEDEREQTATDLYPYLSEKIVQDKAVTDALVAHVGEELDARLKSYTETEMPNALASFKTSLQSQLDAATIVQKNATDQQMASLRRELQQKIDTELPKAVDGMIPSLVTAMMKEFTDHQDEYLPKLAQMLEPYQSLNEQELETLYAKYRDAIIADLVPRILDEGEAEARKRIDAYLAKRLPATAANTSASAAEVPATQAVTEATGTTEEEKTSVEQTQSAEQSNATVITAPQITESETPSSLSTEDYMTEREKIRQEAIRQVLNAIESEK